CGLPSGALDPYLEYHRIALAATRADRRTAEPAAAPSQLEHEASEQARAGSADRMPQRDRTAVHVHALLVDAEHANGVERDRRERLVDLPHVDVGGLKSGLLERLARGTRRRGRQVGEVVGALRVRHDLCESGLAVGFGPL